MAKKSNKTEHVLKLITRDEETLESLKEKDNSKSEIENEKSTTKVDAEFSVKPEIEVNFKQKEDDQPKYEAKVKIEIEPEIQVKPVTVHAETPVLENETHTDVKEDSKSQLIEQQGQLVNIAEVLAKEKISIVMEKMNVCNCQTCFNDVLALTLNILPTKYVTTDAGKQYFQLDMYKNHYETEVLAALTKACVRVKAAPRHEK